MFALILFGSSDAVHKCEVEEKQWRHEHRPHARGEWWGRIYRRAAVNVGCAGSADDVWIALSGLAVAAFTFTLWRSTDRLWLAADAERKANEAVHAHARELAEREFRPWLSLNLNVIDDIVFEEGQTNSGLRVQAVVTVKNVGGTAAKDVLLSADITNHFGFESIRPWADAFVTKCLNDAVVQKNWSDILAPSEELTARFGLMLTGEDLARRIDSLPDFVSPCVVACVVYTAVGGDDRTLHAAKMFGIGRAHGVHFMNINMKALPVNGADARVASMGYNQAS